MVVDQPPDALGPRLAALVAPASAEAVDSAFRQIVGRSRRRSRRRRAAAAVAGAAVLLTGGLVISTRRHPEPLAHLRVAGPGRSVPTPTPPDTWPWTTSTTAPLQVLTNDENTAVRSAIDQVLSARARPGEVRSRGTFYVDDHARWVPKGGHPVTFIWLRADATDLARTLYARFAGRILIEVGERPYPEGVAPSFMSQAPGARPGSPCAAGSLSALLRSTGPLTGTVRLDSPTVRSGADGAATVTITNPTPRPIRITTGDTLMGVVVDPATNDIRSSNGGIVRRSIAVIREIRAGGSTKIRTEFATESCTPGTPPALPPGRYELVVVFGAGDGRSASYGVARTALTIVP